MEGSSSSDEEDEEEEVVVEVESDDEDDGEEEEGEEEDSEGDDRTVPATRRNNGNRSNNYNSVSPWKFDEGDNIRSKHTGTLSSLHCSPCGLEGEIYQSNHSLIEFLSNYYHHFREEPTRPTTEPKGEWVGVIATLFLCPS